MNKLLRFSLVLLGIVALVLIAAGVGMLSYRPWGTPGRAGYGMGPGMMGGYRSSGLTDPAPLPADAARHAVEGYLAALGNGDLEIEEIMIFDNHAYAIVAEASTGIGAFEVLVDPVSLQVYPEHGPNMMWNLKYGIMAGNRMGPGMMGGWAGTGSRVPDVPAGMPVGVDEALQTAQLYLDAQLPGLVVSDEITAFYGYYTIDLERNGRITGMLSVNGFTGQVFLHTWHGDFISMSEEP